MHFFTSVNINYFSKARVLAKSVKAHCKNAKFTLVFSDCLPADINPENEVFDEILTPDQLGIPVDNLPLWIFTHTVVELCTAVKGQALVKLLEEGSSKVVYLDPDIVVYDDLEEIDFLLDTNDVLLTPHQTIPEKNKQDILNNEVCSLKHGVYNFGFFAVKNSDNGLEFARWWRDRLVDFCFDDIPNGLFTDQKWGDIAPALMDGIHILKDPGCNVSTWNITTRNVTKDEDGKYFANGSPLKFYHFSGFDSGAQLTMLETNGENNPALFELRNWYLGEEEKEGHSDFINRPSVYNFFDNGQPIEKLQRFTMRNRLDVYNFFAETNPFVVEQERSYYKWCLTELVHEEMISISRLELQKYNDDLDHYQQLCELKTAELNAFYNSRSWRFTRLLRRLIPF